MNDTMMAVVMVAIGGAIGAVARYSVYRMVDTEFPWATFMVNIIGCTLAAFLMFRFGGDMSDPMRSLIFVGIFGAFTTMSTFSIDVVKLLVAEEYLLALWDFVLNAMVCVGGAIIGRWFSIVL